MELQGRDRSKIIYTETTAPLYGGDEGLYGFSVDVGTVDPKKLRWFAAILAPGSGFRVTPHQSPWTLATQTPPFSIKFEEKICKVLLDVEVLALICARRAPNVAFLSIGAAISGLMPKILVQVKTAQPPLEQHAYAWTGVPQSLDIAGEGAYYETYSEEEYIKRSNCWRLRKLPPLIHNGLHYKIGPFTPWEPPGRGLLKNSPLRVQRIATDMLWHIEVRRGALATGADSKMTWEEICRLSTSFKPFALKRVTSFTTCNFLATKTRLYIAVGP
ncbi:hypothetical protein OEA41_008690 [Lepraria neglecta]|uniref:Uncharacterized protein n=1 Tax=Lepraria neglecta TaxID=209136 RepID=A0AAD9Z2W8_9LECA|nr:hypothetical protein OEA41_008690 [Lepraria neglecta]